MTNLRDMPVITIHINSEDKKTLKGKASEKGMTLATYCRMLLLKAIKEDK